jgi:hypothetical protein
VRADANTLRLRSRRVRPARLVLQWVIVGGIVVVVLAAAVGFLYAGSPKRLAEGVTVAGVDVGGLTPQQAEHRLEERAASVENVPVTFTSGRQQFRIKPS